MKSIHCAIALGAVAILSACGTSPESASDETGGGTLYLYNWAEYIPDELIEAFEAETGSTVVADTYPDNEAMVAKLQGGGVSQYDIVVPTDYIVPNMVELNLLQPLDKDLLPNFSNLDPNFIDAEFDPGNVYTVPYQWGTDGVAYRSDRTDEKFEESWGILFDPELQQGPFVMMDDQRVMIGAAALYLGFDMNTTDPEELQQVEALMLEAKERSSGFIDGVGGKDQVVAGSANAAIVYGGDALRAAEENPDLGIGYFIPEEGTTKWLDSMAIPAEAPNPELAHQFINFLLDAENGAELSNYTQFPTPNAAAKEFVTPEDLENPAIYPPEELANRLFFVRPLAGEEMARIDAIWTNVKGN